MNGEVFSEWLEHFIKFTKPTLEKKVLLILDGHKSHTHSIKALQRASDCGVMMISLPPHTSHRLQPLDLCFFKPLKNYYYQEVPKWLRNHPGRAVTQYQISQLFGFAYGKAASIAFNGFRKAGIYPLDRDVFEEADFLPAEVSDKPYEENREATNLSENEILSADAPPPTIAATSSTLSPAFPAPLPGASSTLSSTFPAPLTASSSFSTGASPAGLNSDLSQSAFSSQSTASLLTPSVAASILCDDLTTNCSESYVSVSEISPLPKKTSAVTRKRRTAKPTLFTGSPHRRFVENSGAKTNKAPKKARKQQKSRKKKTAFNKPCTSATSKPVVYNCLVCGDSNDEDWIQCGTCKECSHEECANITDSRFYNCDVCTSV